MPNPQLSIKQRLIDTWVVLKDGSEMELEIEVPQHIMSLGHDDISDHLDYCARAQVGAEALEVHFTQTW